MQSLISGHGSQVQIYMTACRVYRGANSFTKAKRNDTLLCVDLEDNKKLIRPLLVARYSSWKQAWHLPHIYTFWNQSTRSRNTQHIPQSSQMSKNSCYYCSCERPRYSISMLISSSPASIRSIWGKLGGCACIEYLDSIWGLVCPVWIFFFLIFIGSSSVWFIFLKKLIHIYLHVFP